MACNEKLPGWFQSRPSSLIPYRRKLDKDGLPTLDKKVWHKQSYLPPREGDDCSLSSYFSLDFDNCFLNELLCVYHQLILCFCFDRAATSHYVLIFILSTDLTNSRNGGDGLPGRDLNSGWNCVPTKNLFVGISAISILIPSFAFPENNIPFCSISSIQSGLTSNRCL